MNDTRQRVDQEQPRRPAAQLPGDEPAVAVFVCHCGGNISDVVDVERVVAAARQMDGVAEAEHFMFMCSSAGQELIEKAIREKGCNRVVVAACSPSLHEATFRRALRRAGLNPYLYEPANIREQCSWCHAHDPEGATEKATRLVASAVAKVARARPLKSPRVPVTRRVAVIGGGIAGMRAALDVADRGIDVVLIEKYPFLGGRVAQWETLYPREDSARELVAAMARAVADHPRIQVMLSAEVTAAEGYLGNFTLTVLRRPVATPPPASYLAKVAEAGTIMAPGADGTAAGGPGQPSASGSSAASPAAQMVSAVKSAAEASEQTVEVKVGAVIVATGFDHYTPRDGEFGYYTLPNVFTLPQAIKMLDPEGPTGGRLEVNGRPVRRVAIIHCVGSRQRPGVHEPGPDGRLNEYCSRVCCTAALQTALKIRRRYPDVDVFEYYQDIRAYGRDHETDYYEEACKAGVVFFRYAPDQPPAVEKGKGDWPLTVRVHDLLTYGEELVAGVDMVILSVGMVPREPSAIVEALKLPRGADGFLLEVHPKLRPVELAVDGVMVAGAARGPMDSGEATASASAAAAKVQVLLSGDEVELQPYVAEVNLERCEGVGACAQACGAGAIELVEMEVDGRKVRRAQVAEALCRGCGACVPACPNRAINLRGWSLEQLEAQVVALARGAPPPVRPA